MMLFLQRTTLHLKSGLRCWFSTPQSTTIPRIVFENDSAVVIDKPIGITHHSSEEEDGIMKRMRAMQQKDPNMYGGDLFSVHRLDRDTSGLLLFAKTKSAAAFFSKQFADRKVVKYYIAISNQKPTKKMGLISGDMAPSRRSKEKLLRTQKDPAKTRFISQSFDSGLGRVQRHSTATTGDDDYNDTTAPAHGDDGDDGDDGVSHEEEEEEDVFAKYSTAKAPSLRAFLLLPLTGKKHQLRVMLKSLRAPALGDPMYATKDNFEKSSSDRCYLHACAMRIAMPVSAGDGEDESSSSSSAKSSAVQLILAPTQGRLFTSPGFQACWDTWVLPNMIQQQQQQQEKHNTTDSTTSTTSYTTNTAAGSCSDNIVDNNNNHNNNEEEKKERGVYNKKQFSLLSSSETIIQC